MEMNERMEVAEVRRSLAFVRKCWDAQTCLEPLFICSKLPTVDLTVSEFCFHFVTSHHTKRTA